ncbi:ABC transporter permease [Halorarum halophilum]|uniref:ABC transporter permease n=1 Tax=Halorarum halophilum TaxID=2743090 RepID=A0A7D5GWN5_9EURY|nr:ABC transporter permease subunit [Halobaculum halophilum]QLG27069.1 ABC transporter permease [Halobaculum halophilum]
MRPDPRAVLRIARWEVSRTAGVLDRRTAVLGLVALLLAGGVASAAAAGGGVALDRDIYRVAVPADSPYYEPVADSTPLEAVAPDDPDADLFVHDPDPTDARVTIGVADTPRASAALATFRDAVEAHNDRLMFAEANQSAAFPVSVTLSYVERDSERVGGGGGTGSAGEGSDGAGGAGSGGDSSDGTGDGSNGEADGTGGGFGIPDVTGGGLFGGQPTGSPAEISPPFPFGSLVLAFAFLVPMNFVIQAYGSSVLNERINRRGELLLVAPVTRFDIVAGKTLPYAAVSLAATTVIALAVGGGALSVAAVFPIALAFLAATFVGAMFARSFKELTFVTVTVSVFLTTYAFVPAIFTNVTPIALISPLTLVVRDLQAGAPPTGLGEYLFSAGPFYVTSGILFLIGTGVYREEDMFTQRAVPLKFLDALAVRLHRPRDVAVLAALSLPFVFVLELLAVAVLFVLPEELAIVALLLAVAVVEEVAKSVAIFAGFHQSRFRPDVRTALQLGALAGLGFFLAEKATAIVQLVGLDTVPVGQAAFATGGVGVVGAIGLLAAPLVLHVVTAVVAALGATRGRRAYAATLAVAMAIHFAYDYLVVSTLG